MASGVVHSFVCLLSRTCTVAPFTNATTVVVAGNVPAAVEDLADLQAAAAAAA